MFHIRLRKEILKRKFVRIEIEEELEEFV